MVNQETSKGSATELGIEQEGRNYALQSDKPEVLNISAPLTLHSEIPVFSKEVSKKSPTNSEHMRSSQSSMHDKKSFYKQKRKPPTHNIADSVNTTQIHQTRSSRSACNNQMKYSSEQELYGVLSQQHIGISADQLMLNPVKQMYALHCKKS